MKILFLNAPFRGEVSLCTETVRYLKRKKYKTIGLYASVQFCSKLADVKKQLFELGISIITSKADRAHIQSQLLGCDNYSSSLNLTAQHEQKIDCYLYVGDGKFHPLALAYAQKDNKGSMKEIICDDPIQKKMSLIGINDIRSILKKYKGSLMKFLAAENVGIIATIKPGQEQFRPSLALEQKFPDKKFYYFIDNTISFEQLENFNFIEVWVNSACPRVGFDEMERFRRGVINLNDACYAKEILSRDSIINSL